MSTGWQPLTGLYEPSGISQLPDGRFLVVEDEREHALGLARIDPDGRVHSRSLSAGWLDFDREFWTLDDLEGLTIDPQGRVVAITSHSRNDDGKVKKSRSRLVRFRLDGHHVVDRQVCTTLRDALLAAHPQLADAAGEARAKSDAGFNIEALEFHPDNGTLLIGFRSPLADGRALIATLLNADAVFDDDAAPRLAPALIALDLGGDGLRSIGHVPALAGHLLISGPSDRAERRFRLWFWRGPGHTAVQAVHIDGLADLAHAEGICSAVIGGQACVLIVSDDGDRAAGRPARFASIPLARLHLGPALT